MCEEDVDDGFFRPAITWGHLDPISALCQAGPLHLHAAHPALCQTRSTIYLTLELKGLTRLSIARASTSLHLSTQAQV